MNWRRVLSLAAMMALAIALLPANAMAQQTSLKQQIIGTWTLVAAADVHENGSKVDDWGPTVKGVASFDANGRFTWMIIGAETQATTGSPRVANRMVVAYYGSYTVDEARKTVSYTAEHSTSTIMDGLKRTASVILNGDDMTQNSEPIATPRGKLTPQTVFKRGK